MRYFHLLVFQAYLDDTVPDDETAFSFESFVKHRPVFKTLEQELRSGGVSSLMPIERADPATGMAVSLLTQTSLTRSSSKTKRPRLSPAVLELFSQPRRFSSRTTLLVCRSRVCQSMWLWLCTGKILANHSQTRRRCCQLPPSSSCAREYPPGQPRSGCQGELGVRYWYAERRGFA